MSDARGGWDEGDDARKSAMLTMSAFILLDVAAIALNGSSKPFCSFLQPPLVASQTTAAVLRCSIGWYIQWQRCTMTAAGIEECQCVMLCQSQ